MKKVFVVLTVCGLVLGSFAATTAAAAHTYLFAPNANQGSNS